MRSDVFDANYVTWILIAVVAYSLYQGFRRGASGSVKQLLFFMVSALIAIAAVVVSALSASAVSPHLQNWLVERSLIRPEPDTSFFTQLVYTVQSSLRDLPLLRFAVLFLVFYLVVRLLTGLVTTLFARLFRFRFPSYLLEEPSAERLEG